MDLSYSVDRLDGWTVVSVTGEIDVYSAATLREPLNDLVDQPDSAVLLDLERVEFMDSMGLRVIVGAHRRAMATGSKFALICSRPQVRNVLQITGLDEVITSYAEMPPAHVPAQTAPR